MIKVTKDKHSIPASLSNVSIQANLNSIWNTGIPDKNLIDSNVYTAPDVKKALSDLYHDKCAYCETHDPGFDVEHFRPKKLLAVVDRVIGQDHHGYYWLCYEWTNLMPGCHDCNKNGVKGFRFPTENGKKNAPNINGGDVDIPSNQYHADYLLSEKPIFLNPEEDNFNPFYFFKFDETGFMEAKPEPASFDNKRAETTITVFKLNREKIYLTYRKWHLEKIFKRVQLRFVEYVAKKIDLNYFRQTYFEILEEIYVETKAEKQYSFFWDYTLKNASLFISMYVGEEGRMVIDPLTDEFIALKQH